MEILSLTLAVSLLEKLSGIASTGGSIMWAALGLGFVIFFHEMGHFAVARGIHQMSAHPTPSRPPRALPYPGRSYPCRRPCSCGPRDDWTETHAAG